MSNCEKVEQFVCISCVEELRYSFVSHLSGALRRTGIKYVVVDVDCIEESLEKVEKARVSVVVLPGDDEPTRVCLRYFKMVLECKRNTNQVVVPVLYGNSPLHDEWFSALDLKGFSPVHQSRNGFSDSELVEEIARDVYEKLFCMDRIGIYSKLMEIEKMVCEQQPFGIRCVGIWGMPGIGKTTLAKAVFDQMSGDFDACCFIEDYEKAIHKKGLYCLLEEQFLKEMPGTSRDITTLNLLRDKLNNKRILVVLDDVQNALVAESFLEGFEWWGPESLIIITSRDKRVFSLCQINQVFEVQGLNEKDALQLFLLCASIKDIDAQSLHDLSMKVVKYTNGHPLALTIYGRELKHKRKLSEIETALFKLKQHPPFKIVDAFKSSYDTLSDREKNIFLDIACFFQGETVDYVVQLLEGCGFFPHVGIDVLVEKCLVTVSENRVRMHNLIQEFGRSIINGDTGQVERRSRLWEPWSIFYLLKDDGEKANAETKATIKRAQSTEEIQGIFLDTSNLNIDVKPAAFENMSNLRLLKIYCSNPETHPVINFPEGFIHSLPNELRLLHWENYPQRSLPQNIDPSHLVEINMPRSQLQKLWDGTKNLQMLRTIKLSHSQQLDDIEIISKAQNLEVIDLQGCTRMQHFPAISHLLHLRVVNLSGCTAIKSFPELPPNIETLHLQGTSITELPHSIFNPNGGQLGSLLAGIQYLSDALKQEILMKRSSVGQDLGKLVFLDLKDCSCLQSLPNMVTLEMLKVLDLSGCSELKSIQGFPRNLKKLNIVGTALREVPQLPQSLELLNAHGCVYLTCLPHMVDLEILKVLDLSGCSELKSIQDLPRNLKELNIAGTAVREVPQLPQSLEILNAHGCVYLKSFSLDSEKLPMYYTFSNCINLSPQVVNTFLVKGLAYVKDIPREHQLEPNKAPAFSFCAPSHTYQNSSVGLQPGSSVMTRLNPSGRNMLVGFALMVDIEFSEDYCGVTGLGINYVCRWKNKKGHSEMIEKNLQCWAPGTAVPKVQKDHIFVFCDVEMGPITSKGDDTDIWADLVVFEFFPVDMQKKRRLEDDICRVKKCGVYAIDGATCNTSLKMSSLPGSSMDPMEVSSKTIEEVLKVRYNGLLEMNQVLFLYIACLFNEEDDDFVAPLIADNIDLDVSFGLKVLASRSLIHISSNGGIWMHCLVKRMGKEILHTESILPGSSKDLAIDFGKVFCMSLSDHNSKFNVFLSFHRQDVPVKFISSLVEDLGNVLIDGGGRPKEKEADGGWIEITQAMPNSQPNISVVLFTINYASSSWLLNELVEKAKVVNEDLSQKVIPIFHPNVDPTDVREQTGEFGRIFNQTCKNKTEDQVQQWRRALTDVASLLENDFTICDSSAEKFINSIIEVAKKLLANVPVKGVVPMNEVFFVPARSLIITRSKNPKLWTWSSIYDGQSEAHIEIATLVKIYWLQIEGYFHTRKLTPGTKYNVVFMVRLDDKASGWGEPVTLKLKLKHGDETESLQETTLSLNDYIGHNWVDILAGEFEATPGNMEMFFSLHQYVDTDRKSGLMVKGVAIRPEKLVGSIGMKRKIR